MVTHGNFISLHEKDEKAEDEKISIQAKNIKAFVQN